MKTTGSILSGIAASLIPLLPSEVSAAFTQNVAVGAWVSGETIDGSGGGTQQVYGVATDTAIDDGGVQIIHAGGITNSTVINSGGELQNHGGEDNATALKAGGAFILAGQANSYAISNHARIEDHCTLAINDYVQTDNWTINAGNSDYINLDGASSVMQNTQVNGGRLWILAGKTINTTLNSGNFVNVQGIDINTVINGGTYFLGGITQARSENLTINSGGSGHLNSGTIKNATISGSLTVTPNQTNPAILSSLEGEIVVNNGGKLVIETGADTGKAAYTVAGLVYLSSNSAYAGKFDFTLGDVALAGGTISYDTNGYSVLTLDSLSGSGSFLINTRIPAMLGDFLSVTGNATGSFDLYVADSGISPSGGERLQVVQTGSGDAAFRLGNSGNVVDLGTWQYHLVADDRGGWSLTPQSAAEEEVGPTPGEGAEAETPPDTPTDNESDNPPDTPTDNQSGNSSDTPADNQPDMPADEQPGVDEKTETPTETTPVPTPPGGYSITPSAAAVLSVATVDPLIFRQELEMLSGRLVSIDASEHDYDVWSTARNARLNVSDEAGADYRLSFNSLTIGADNAWHGANSMALRGIFFSYGHSDMRFRGKGIGKADIDSWSGGLYGRWQHNKGYWLDGALKINRFMHEIRARMTSGGAADGSFNTYGIGSGIRAGKAFQAGAAKVTPWIAVTGFTGKSSNLSLSNGMAADIGPQRSLTTAAGIRVEYAAQSGPVLLRPWASVSVERESVKSNRTKINGDTFKNELSGGRGVYQAGLRAELSSALSLHISAGYLEGQHITSPWNATAGINWRF